MLRELNGKDNAKFLLMDAGGREMLSLERSINGKIEKADIFTVPVSFNTNEVKHVDTPQEALAAAFTRTSLLHLTHLLAYALTHLLASIGENIERCTT